MRIATMAVLLSIVHAYAQQALVLFLGVIPGGGPEIEKSLERMLLAQFETIREIELINPDETEYIRNKTQFDSHPVISPVLLRELANRSGVKKVVVWASIKQYTFKYKRHRIFQAKPFGALSVTVSVYDVDSRSYHYHGDIAVETACGDNTFIFLDDVDKTMQISASQRAAMIRDLQQKSVEATVTALKNILHQFNIRSRQVVEENSNERKATSVSDLFKIPSIEAPTLNATQQGNSDSSAAGVSKKRK